MVGNQFHRDPGFPRIIGLPAGTEASRIILLSFYYERQGWAGVSVLLFVIFSSFNQIMHPLHIDRIDSFREDEIEVVYNTGTDVSIQVV